MCRSVPQIVVVSTHTMTSVGATSLGSGTSSRLLAGPWYTNAFISDLLVGMAQSTNAGFRCSLCAPADVGSKVPVFGLRSASTIGIRDRMFRKTLRRPHEQALDQATKFAATLVGGGSVSSPGRGRVSPPCLRAGLDL